MRGGKCSKDKSWKNNHHRFFQFEAPFDCQSTVNNIFIKRENAFLFIEILKGTTKSTGISIFGPPIWWRQRRNQWFYSPWDENRKMRCGIQVVACLHVKSIHQLKLIEWKQPKFDKREKKAIKFHWRQKNRNQQFLLVWHSQCKREPIWMNLAIGHSYFVIY